MDRWCRDRETTDWSDAAIVGWREREEAPRPSRYPQRAVRHGFSSVFLEMVVSHFQRSAGVVLVLVSTAASAAEPKNITQGELALTPPFCQDVQTINGWSQHGRESPRSPYWIAQMGKTFWGMHHYCWAQVNLQRSRMPAQTPQERDFKIRSAINDYYYVVEIAPPDFVLLPEVFYLIGEAHVLVNEYVPAIEAFQKARRLKLDYWPPYEGHAKVLEKLDKKVEARAVLAEGLRVMPGEPRLVAMFTRLGGDAARLPTRPQTAVPADAAQAKTPSAAAQPASTALPR